MQLQQTLFLALLAGCSSTQTGGDEGADGRVIVPIASAKATASRAEPPPVPSGRERPLRVGDDFTVRGALRRLRPQQDETQAAVERITVVGYIVHSNFSEAPPCAVHRTGILDPPDCHPPTPAFWLGDDEDGEGPRIKVMGFASSFSQLYRAIVEARNGNQQPWLDEFWGKNLPVPLPSVGARVRVRGRYGISFTIGKTWFETDRRYGILTYESMSELEPAPVPATLPGM